MSEAILRKYVDSLPMKDLATLEKLIASRREKTKSKAKKSHEKIRDERYEKWKKNAELDAVRMLNDELTEAERTEIDAGIQSGIRDFEKGEFITSDEMKARLDKRIAKLEADKCRITA